MISGIIGLLLQTYLRVKIDGQPITNDCQVLGYDSLYDEAAQEQL